MSGNNQGFARSFDDASSFAPSSGVASHPQPAEPMAAFPADNELNTSHQGAFGTARRQSVPGSFYSDQQQIAALDENLRRATTMDFSAQQPLGSVNPFGYDASMAALDPSFSETMQMHMAGASQAINVPVPDMSMETQFQTVMGYNPLSAPGYQSALGMNQMGSFLTTSPSMPLSLDTDAMSGMPAMADVFATHQYDTPILTSPMVANFGPPVFGSSDVPMSAAPASQMLGSDPTSQMMGSDPNRGPLGATRDFQQAEQRRVQQAPAEPPAPAKLEKVKAEFPEPPGGWPSSMPGSKPHAEKDRFKDAYASSGFDLLTTLYKVMSRKNPQVKLGAVDMSCAFLVCDALAHDTPIVYCSESFERLTGYTKYEIIGQNCRFLQSSDGHVQAGVPRKQCDDNSVFFLKNSLVKGTEAQISIINYKKWGHPFMNLLTMIPIRDDDGQVYQFVGFQVDIVETPDALNMKGSDGSLTVNYQRREGLRPYMRSAQEQGLMGDYGQTLTPADVTRAIASLATASANEQSERMFEKVLLDNADDVIYVLSLKGLFLYASPSCRRVLEYEPSELIGNPLSSVCHPSDIVPVTRELKDSQIENSISVVFRIRRKNSGYVWFESYGSLQTELGKSRKCIILVGRERPVYTLTKTNIMAAGGIGDHEMWSKMSTTGMFLYISGHVKSLIDHQPEELVGTNIQALMRPDSKAEFERVLSLALTGQSVQVKHELINRRGQVVQAHSWLYPGDAVEGHKPSFLVAQTRLIKYTRSSRSKPEAPQSSAGGGSSQRLSGGASSGATPQSGGSSSAAATTGGSGRAMSTSTTAEGQGVNLHSTPGTAASGLKSMPMGRQDAQLASAENIFDELKTTRSSSWQFELRQLERRNRMLADEVQRLAAARKKRKRRRGGASAEGLLVKDCANCHATETPEWRRGPSGNRDLCNSCGLRWAKQQGRISPRPASARQSIDESIAAGGGGPLPASRPSASPTLHQGGHFPPAGAAASASTAPALHERPGTSPAPATAPSGAAVGEQAPGGSAPEEDQPMQGQ